MSSTLEILNAATLAFYGNKPTAQLIQASSQNVLNNTDTALQWTGASVDNWAGWSSGSNTRYTVQVAGVYRVTGQESWAANATGRRLAWLAKNGTEVDGSGTDLTAGATIFAAPTATMEISLVVGDYLEIIVNQNSGGTLATNSGTNLMSGMSIEFSRFP